MTIINRNVTFLQIFCYVQEDIYLLFSTIYMQFSNLRDSTYKNIHETLTRHLIFFAWLSFFRFIIYSVELFRLAFLRYCTEATHFSYICTYSLGPLYLLTGF